MLSGQPRCSLYQAFAHDSHPHSSLGSLISVDASLSRCTLASLLPSACPSPHSPLPNPNPYPLPHGPRRRHPSRARCLRPAQEPAQAPLADLRRARERRRSCRLPRSLPQRVPAAPVVHSREPERREPRVVWPLCQGAHHGVHTTTNSSHQSRSRTAPRAATGSPARPNSAPRPTTTRSSS